MREKLFNSLIILFTIVTIVGITTASIYYFDPFEKGVITKTVKDVTVTEADSIKSAVDKVYDAVVLLESYDGDDHIGSGTGFIYKTDDKVGYIITNQHVVEGADSVKVTNIEGQEVEATILGTDVYSDIAVLSIDKKAVLKVAAIGESDEVSLGDTVFTVGSPLGKAYMGTVTKGILSGKNRSITVKQTNGSYIVTVLQTDAAINPGNSGGPLLNINGEVIGVNSLKLVEDEIEGMGFALPIEEVMPVVNKLETGEEIKRPYLGVGLADVDNAYYLFMQNIFIDETIEAGAVITEVEKGKPADLAGIKKGDVIVAINDIKVKDSAEFRYNLYKYEVGETITVKYFRGETLKTTTIKLTESI